MRNSILGLVALIALSAAPVAAQEKGGAQLEELRSALAELKAQQARLERKIESLLETRAPRAHVERRLDAKTTPLPELHQHLKEMFEGRGHGGILKNLGENGALHFAFPGGEGKSKFKIHIHRNDNGEITEKEIEADSLEELQEKQKELGDAFRFHFGGPGGGMGFPFGGSFHIEGPVSGHGSLSVPFGSPFFGEGPVTGHGSLWSPFGLRLFREGPGSGHGNGHAPLHELHEHLEELQRRFAPGAQPGVEAPVPAPRRLGVMVSPREDAEGLAVIDVTGNGLARSMGIKKGDVLLEVNGEAIGGVGDVAEALRKGGAKVRVLVERPGKGRVALEGKAQAPKLPKVRKTRLRKI